MKRRSLQEDGFTLVEMMVTIAVMIVVMFALYSVFDMTVRVFMFANDKVEAVENARLGLERMEREIRAAYPYEKPSGDEQLFDGMGTTRITFGNDRGIGDRYIDQATEEIAYGLSATGPPYTLQRAVGSGTPQPVVEYIGEFDDGTPGLRFVYLKRSGTDLVVTSAEPEIEAVRITIVVDKDGRRQEITTDVDLRNRG
jgi:prepilin-type N-terminal cleavage/methylation domain-containing protein